MFVDYYKVTIKTDKIKETYKINSSSYQNSYDAASTALSMFRDAGYAKALDNDGSLTLEVVPVDIDEKGLC